jgi:endonuclease/exonuclease/phosphatase family metal-dependent hydrolase
VRLCIPRPGLLAGLLLLLPAATPAGASSFRAILVDGGLSDWQGISESFTDPSFDNGSAPVDVRRVWIANDDRFVFVRFEVDALVNLQGLGSPLRVHFDTDDNPATGYAVGGIGAEIAFHFSMSSGSGARVYEETSGDPQASLLGHGAIGAYASPTAAATQFELRLRRDTNLPALGRAAFNGPDFRLAIEVLDGGGTTRELAPDASAGGQYYAFASGTQPPDPDIDLARADPRHVRIMNYNVQNDGLFDAGNQARLARIFQALEPDLVGIEEVWGHSAGDVAALFDSWLPLGGGASWQAAQGNRSQVTVSRWPITVHTSGPADELTVLADLPDSSYGNDLYLITSHFKCCGVIGDSNDQQRQDAADAIVAWIRDLETPGGVVDLPEGTPIVHVGDFNLVGGPQPLLTLLTGDIQDEGTYGPDFPPDWDGTDQDTSLTIHSDSRTFYTWRNDFSSFAPGKLDYVLFTDSAVERGNHFVLNTLSMSPAKLSTWGLQQDDTHLASDHLPLVQDLDPDPAPPTVARSAVPAAARIESVVPNPFNPNARILFRLGERARVRLTVYGVSGGRIRLLRSGDLDAGLYEALWDGRDAGGRIVASGVYYARLETRGPHGSAVSSAKLVLTK